MVKDVVGLRFALHFWLALHCFRKGVYPQQKKISFMAEIYKYKVDRQNIQLKIVIMRKRKGCLVAGRRKDFIRHRSRLD